MRRCIGRRGGRLPAVVALHGGGFTLGDPNGVGMWAKYLAIVLGVTTVSVSYRLGTPERPTFPVPVADATDALRWLRAFSGRLGVDGGRVILAGESAGTCIAALTLGVLENPLAGELGRLGRLGGELPARVGLIAQWGPMDFVARWFDNGCKPGAEVNLLGTTYMENPSLYHRASLISYVRPGMPRALFV